MRQQLIAALVVLSIAGCAAAPAEITDEPTASIAETQESMPTDAPTATEEVTIEATEPPTETEEPTEMAHVPLFGLTCDAPAVEHGHIDGNLTTFTGPIVFHEGQYTVFYSGFPETQSEPTTIGYATSEDGVMWTEIDGVLLTSDDVPDMQDVFGLASGALVDESGMWVMYVSVWRPVRFGIGKIYRATAPAPEGPWTMGEAVLEPGEEGDWDDQSLFGASVMRTEDGYLMAYQGESKRSRTSPRSIGIATSADGITWTKYDDPATTDAPYANSDPVLVPEADTWELDGEMGLNGIGEPDIHPFGDGYMMLYNSIQGSGERGFGLAFSEDGIHWARHPRNPVFTPEDVPTALFLHSARMTCQSDVCFLLTELVFNSSTSDLWRADSMEPLEP